MNKKLLITGSILGLISIIFGAFGSHGLKALVSPENILTFEIGVRYQMYHALFLLLVGSTSLVTPKNKNLIFYFTVIGIVFFSGSIYGLATNSLTSFDFTNIAFITPIGGLLLILAWLMLLINFLKTSFDK